jgi:aromatic-L-amino-acid decarboxylase
VGGATGKPSRGRKKKERRTASRFARRDFDALGPLLDGAVEIVRNWTAASAGDRNRIFPAMEGVDLFKRLHEPLPERGRSAATLLRQVERDLIPFLRDSGNPRFFGYVQSPPSAAGIAGDLLASAFGQNLTSWRSAPAATEIERLVVDWLRQIVGLPTGAGGLLTSGGSMATFIAMSVARTTYAPADTVRGGLGQLGDRLMTLYVSDQVHMSVPRAAELLGLGTAAIRVLPTDRRFRLDPTALEKAITDDRKQGHIPFCVAATAGTVNTGAVDPLARIARITRRHGLWLHVDAAYGGPLGLSDHHRPLLAGIAQADSITLDPHKWLYAPMDTGCVLFRQGDAARPTFATSGDYATVFESGEREAYAFFDHGPELSRRWRALKVWLLMKYHGTSRLARRIEEDVELAHDLANRLQNADEIELLAPTETSIVCFRYVPVAWRQEPALPEERLDRLNQDLLLALQHGGRVYLSNARVKGRFALRACLTNFRTTRVHIEATVREVLAEGKRQAERVSPPA